MPTIRLSEDGELLPHGWCRQLDHQTLRGLRLLGLTSCGRNQDAESGRTALIFALQDAK